MYYVITHEFNGYKHLSFHTSECFRYYVQIYCDLEWLLNFSVGHSKWMERDMRHNFDRF